MVTSHKPPKRRRRPAFTLVELLVVVGIISVLIAVLLPALNRAREHANQVKCLATLRGMGQAAQAHAAERRGYMPLAGQVPRGPWPYQVGDRSMVKYMYYPQDLSGAEPTEGPAVVLQPLATALAHYMNVPVDVSSRQAVWDSVTSEAVYRHFTCPADPEPLVGGVTVASTVPPWTAPPPVMSYGFNAAVLGLMPDAGRPGLGGNVVRCRRPSEVFLFVDARATLGPHGGFRVPVGETLYDYWQIQSPLSPPSANRVALFDHSRHRNRANVLFVDGHAASVMLPLHPVRSGVTLDQAGKGDLERVGVWRGIAE